MATRPRDKISIHLLSTDIKRIPTEMGEPKKGGILTHNSQLYEWIVSLFMLI